MITPSSCLSSVVLVLAIAGWLGEPRAGEQAFFASGPSVVDIKIVCQRTKDERRGIR